MTSKKTMANKTNGKIAPPAPSQPAEGFSLISNAKLLSLYSTLIRCRRAGAVRGYEAGLVAATIDLASGDMLCTPGTAISASIAKAVFSQAEFEFLPSATSRGSNQSSKNKGEPIDLSADQFHAILGASLASRTRKDGKVTVLFTHGLPVGLWHEALEIAVAHSLPIVFVNQARRRAVVPRAGRPTGKANPKHEPERPYLPSIPVDASDLVAIYRVASEGIGRARKGRGPTLVECVPFHPALRESATGDSVKSMETYLRRKGLYSTSLKREAHSH